MSNYQTMIFGSSRGTETQKGIRKIEDAVDVVSPVGDTTDTEETLLRTSYLKHPNRLLTEVLDERGIPEIKTLKGVIFPAAEIAKVINNSDQDIHSVFIEFCHHGDLSGKDEFSLMITGLNENDERVKMENGESRVYEFAQSCPKRCPR